MSLLTHKPRAASIYAKGDVVCAGKFVQYSCSVILSVLVLNVEAFERLLGPCIEVMKRNIQTYEEQLMGLFGETFDISDTR